MSAGSRYFDGVQRMSCEHQADASETSGEEVLQRAGRLRLLGHVCCLLFYRGAERNNNGDDKSRRLNETGRKNISAETSPSCLVVGSRPFTHLFTRTDHTATHIQALWSGTSLLGVRAEMLILSCAVCLNNNNEPAQVTSSFLNGSIRDVINDSRCH